MKGNKENKEFLIFLIDYVTSFLTNGVKKLGRLASSKKTHDTVNIFTKIIVTLLVIYLLSIPMDFIKQLGVILIYSVGSTFRGVLSFSWSCIVQIGYSVLSLVLLLQVLDKMFKDKELNFIEDNRKKDSSVKKKIFQPIIKIVKVLLMLFAIPFAIICALSLIGLGAIIGLYTKGYYFIGGLFIILGIFIMSSSTIALIKKIVNGGSL